MEAQHSARATTASRNTVRLRDVQQQHPPLSTQDAIPQEVDEGEEITQYPSTSPSRSPFKRLRARRIVESSSSDEADDEQEGTLRSFRMSRRARAQPVHSSIAERVKLSKAATSSASARESATRLAQVHPPLGDAARESSASASASDSSGFPPSEDLSPSLPPTSTNTVRIADLVKEGKVKGYNMEFGSGAPRHQSVSITLPLTKVAAKTPLARRASSRWDRQPAPQMSQQPANLNALRG
ncbi:uncharacterized protein BDZ99DRAFT_457040, partial [Mytilinidion resinicola]